MTINDIGNYAGIIWGALVRKGLMSIQEIGEQTRLTEDSIYAALGWLSREGKIQINYYSDFISVELKNMSTEVFF